MKYLDEDIYISVSGFTATGSTYVYEVLDESNNVVFHGNCFLASGTTTYNFYINDLIRDWRYANTNLNISNITSGYENAQLYKRFRVKLTVGGTNYTSAAQDVMLAYRYPNKKDSMAFPPVASGDTNYLMLQGYHNGKYNLVPRYPQISTYEYPFIITTCRDYSNYPPINVSSEGGLYGTFYMSIPSSLSGTSMRTLQSMYNALNPYITVYTISIFPINGFVYDDQGDYYEATCDQYTLTVSQWDEELHDYVVYYDATSPNRENVISIPIDEKFLNRTSSYPLIIQTDDGNVQPQILVGYADKIDLIAQHQGSNFIFSFTDDEPTQSTVHIYGINAKIPVESQDSVLKIGSTIVGKIDSCPAPYYLMWQDRAGSYQSQPFNNKVTYSESFNKTNIKNYKDESKLKAAVVSSKWKVCTDWIPEDLFPLYESIFISPYLLLYDTAENKSYKVLVTGDWTEKTFRNSKSLINLTLELDNSKVQQMIY